MAMIRCPECNCKVSSTAIACPNCGFNVAANYKPPVPLTREEKRKEFVTMVKLILILGILCVVVCGLNNLVK